MRLVSESILVCPDCKGKGVIRIPEGWTKVLEPGKIFTLTKSECTLCEGSGRVQTYYKAYLPEDLEDT